MEVMEDEEECEHDQVLDRHHAGTDYCIHGIDCEQRGSVEPASAGVLLYSTWDGAHHGCGDDRDTDCADADLRDLQASDQTHGDRHEEVLTRTSFFSRISSNGSNRTIMERRMHMTIVFEAVAIFIAIKASVILLKWLGLLFDRLEPPKREKKRRNS